MRRAPRNALQDVVSDANVVGNFYVSQSPAKFARDPGKVGFRAVASIEYGTAEPLPGGL